MLKEYLQALVCSEFKLVGMELFLSAQKDFFSGVISCKLFCDCSNLHCVVHSASLLQEIKRELKGSYIQIGFVASRLSSFGFTAP